MSGIEGSGDFETTAFESAFNGYVQQAESFVQTMYEGLLSLQSQDDQVVVTPKRAIRIASQKKILVVEETEVHRVLFGRYFQGYPLQIMFARNAGEAAQLQAATVFDLVVTDWKLQLQRGLSKQDLVEKVLAKLEA